MKKLIVGNWKMNTARAEAKALAQGLRTNLGSGNAAFDMVICPPAVWLADMADIAPLSLGAQDCHEADKGAFTGNIAAPMLKELGCSHVIVGHSERRQHHGESSALVKAKAENAMRHGLVPIICVGEGEADRTAGRHEQVVGQQLVESLPSSGVYVVAYEPIWAIGTGKTATAEDVRAMHAFIRNRIDHADKVAILYGGSVKAGNAREILHTDNVDGVLVGGASLSLEEFWAIAQAA